MQCNRHLWISARPNGPDVPHHLNRIELRICDYIYDPRIILGIAALVEARIQQLVTDPSLDPLVASELPASTRADDLRQLIEQNDAAVATHSLGATVRHWRNGRARPVREWLETYLAGALATAKPLGFGQYLQPLWQIVNSGNVAMQWLEQHKRGASIAAIMGQSVIAMREAEMLYAKGLRKNNFTELAPLCRPLHEGRQRLRRIHFKNDSDIAGRFRLLTPDTCRTSRLKRSGSGEH
jgi:predicted glutamate--cysteine ligase